MIVVDAIAGFRSEYSVATKACSGIENGHTGVPSFEKKNRFSFCFFSGNVCYVNK